VHSKTKIKFESAMFWQFSTFLQPMEEYPFFKDIYVGSYMDKLKDKVNLDSTNESLVGNNPHLILKALMFGFLPSISKLIINF